MNTKDHARSWLTQHFTRAQSSVGITSTTADMSPLLAQVILEERNSRNRPIKRATIKKVEQAIREDRWKLTSQGISFSRDGVLNNGQNRLHAIVSAGKTVPIHICFGEDDDAFDVIDTALSVRSGSDVATMLGYKNGVVLFSAARLVSIIESGHPVSNAALPNHKVEEFLESHPGLPECVNVGNMVRQGKRGFTTSAVAAAVYLIKKTTRYEDKLEEFIDKLKTGANLDGKSPILALRAAVDNRSVDAEFRDGTTKSAALALSIVKTWNAHVSKQTGRKQNIIWRREDGVPTAK